jgi:exoribonuclease R
MYTYPIGDSNRMIEEFMLMANETVAAKVTIAAIA